jgi:hypothetical protein
MQENFKKESQVELWAPSTINAYIDNLRSIPTESRSEANDNSMKLFAVKQELADSFSFIRLFTNENIETLLTSRGINCYSNDEIDSILMGKKLFNAPFESIIVDKLYYSKLNSASQQVFCANTTPSEWIDGYRIYYKRIMTFPEMIGGDSVKDSYLRMYINICTELHNFGASVVGKLELKSQILSYNDPETLTLYWKQNILQNGLILTDCNTQQKIEEQSLFCKFEDNYTNRYLPISKNIDAQSIYGAYSISHSQELRNNNASLDRFKIKRNDLEIALNLCPNLKMSGVDDVTTFPATLGTSLYFSACDSFN